MKEDVFNLCRDFHLALIRKPVSDEILTLVKRKLVDGDDLAGVGSCAKRRAISAADKIENRYKMLTDFHNGDWGEKCKIYNSIYQKNPKPAVFAALRDVLHDGAVVNAASIKHGVNSACVAVLKRRFEFYIENADKLSKLVKTKV